MRLGFETIGNATIIVHDEKPILVTDPWIQGTAYFGSWRLSHEVPATQRESALKCPYVWISHGHPDHLNPDSIDLFKGKKILLPDHRGGRIARDLKGQGFDVTILPNRKWQNLTENVKIYCLADLGQDAVLLLDINGRLLINTNDCGNNGWGYCVFKIAQRYKTRILTSLSGYGDADMIHFYDSRGHFIEPLCGKREPIGPQINEAMRTFGANAFIPSSSMHRYNRTDSGWANAFGTSIEDHGKLFDPMFGKLYGAFLRYNCEDDSTELINPKENPEELHSPEEYGDDWSERLTTDDMKKIVPYFKRVESLEDTIGFINFRVGGTESHITLSNKEKRGITFEVPRHSLMTAIQYEIFEDLLIGNFMKTTLHGDWPQVSLHPYFPAYVCKYGDNGQAWTKQEVAAYIAHYEQVYPRLRLKRWETNTKELFRSVLETTGLFQAAKNTYQLLRRNPLTRF